MIAERTKPVTINTKPVRGEVVGEACYVCGKTTRTERRRWIRIVDGGMVAVHAEDLAAYEAKQTASDGYYDRGDCGSWPIGSDCCKRQSLREFTFTIEQG